jgi:hypothetical protein
MCEGLHLDDQFIDNIKLDKLCFMSVEFGADVLI